MKNHERYNNLSAVLDELYNVLAALEQALLVAVETRQPCTQVIKSQLISVLSSIIVAQNSQLECI